MTRSAAIAAPCGMDPNRTKMHAAATFAQLPMASPPFEHKRSNGVVQAPSGEKLPIANLSGVRVILFKPRFLAGLARRLLKLKLLPGFLRICLRYSKLIVVED